MLNSKIRPRAVVGYGVKMFLPSPPNYVTRSPGLSLIHTTATQIYMKAEQLSQFTQCIDNVVLEYSYSTFWTQQSHLSFETTIQLTYHHKKHNFDVSVIFKTSQHVVCVYFSIKQYCITRREQKENPKGGTHSWEELSISMARPLRVKDLYPCFIQFNLTHPPPSPSFHLGPPT